MAGWHHWLDGREFGWTPEVGGGQGGLACCDSWGHKELDTTEWLNWTELMVRNTRKDKSSLWQLETDLTPSANLGLDLDVLLLNINTEHINTEHQHQTKPSDTEIKEEKARYLYRPSRTPIRPTSHPNPNTHTHTLQHLCWQNLLQPKPRGSRVHLLFCLFQDPAYLTLRPSWSSVFGADVLPWPERMGLYFKLPIQHVRVLEVITPSQQMKKQNKLKNQQFFLDLSEKWGCYWKLSLSVLWCWIKSQGKSCG